MGATFYFDMKDSFVTVFRSRVHKRNVRVEHSPLDEKDEEKSNIVSEL